MLNDVEFREVQEITKIDKVKIVACDGKSEYFRCKLGRFGFDWLCFVDVSEEGGSKK